MTQQTPWPPNRDHLTLWEVATLLEPRFSSGPLMRRYEARASERARQIEEAQKERWRAKEVAALNGDFDASARADALFKHENSDDPTLMVDVAKVVRLKEICSAILSIAQSHRVPLIDPLSGMYTVERNEESWIDKDGFEKIRSVLVHHGKRATLPVVCPEPEGAAVEIEAQPKTIAAPAPTLSSGTRTNKAANAQEACEEWIGAQNQPPKNKAAAFQEAKTAVAAIGPLSQRAFDLAWAYRAPPEWKKAGAKKHAP